eukprot:919118-Pelagomonas_calceolata.AAC.4
MHIKRWHVTCTAFAVHQQQEQQQQQLQLGSKSTSSSLPGSSVLAATVPAAREAQRPQSCCKGGTGGDGLHNRKNPCCKGSILGMGSTIPVAREAKVTDGLSHNSRCKGGTGEEGAQTMLLLRQQPLLQWRHSLYTCTQLSAATIPAAREACCKKDPGEDGL